MGLGAERRSHRFSAAATARLEEEYARNPIPSRETRCLLARELGVSLRQVQVWLQNKRQRTKAREASKPQDPQLKHDGDASIVRSIPYAEAELPPNGLNMEIFVASYPPFPGDYNVHRSLQYENHSALTSRIKLRARYALSSLGVDGLVELLRFQRQ